MLHDAEMKVSLPTTTARGRGLFQRSLGPSRRLQAYWRLCDGTEFGPGEPDAEASPSMADTTMMQGSSDTKTHGIVLCLNRAGDKVVAFRQV